MGLISFILDLDRNASLEKQARAMEDQARAMDKQTQAMEDKARAAKNKNSNYMKQLKEENKVLRERVNYLESLLKNHLK